MSRKVVISNDSKYENEFILFQPAKDCKPRILPAGRHLVFEPSEDDIGKVYQAIEFPEIESPGRPRVTGMTTTNEITLDEMEEYVAEPTDM